MIGLDKLADPQARIYKNIETIQWVRPVHELVTGAQDEY